jgi:hypothetical protein
LFCRAKKLTKNNFVVRVKKCNANGKEEEPSPFLN